MRVGKFEVMWKLVWAGQRRHTYLVHVEDQSRVAEGRCQPTAEFRPLGKEVVGLMVRGAHEADLRASEADARLLVEFREAVPIHFRVVLGPELELPAPHRQTHVRHLPNCPRVEEPPPVLLVQVVVLRAANIHRVPARGGSGSRCGGRSGGGGRPAAWRC